MAIDNVTSRRVAEALHRPGRKSHGSPHPRPRPNGQDLTAANQGAQADGVLKRSSVALRAARIKGPTSAIVRLPRSSTSGIPGGAKRSAVVAGPVTLKFPIAASTTRQSRDSAQG
jgi:hypothetical protein